MSEINRRAEYKVASLNARCPLSGEGCGWEGKLKEIEGHMEDCLQDNREVCQLKMKRCDYCNQGVKANEENRHKGKCQYHPDTEVSCPYKELGCEAIVLRKNMNTHITENMDNHNKLMRDQIKQLNQLRTKNQRLDRTNQQQKNRNEELERVNVQQKNKIEEVERVNEQQENRNEQQENRNVQLERVNQQQKTRNVQLERVNQQQKTRNVPLERVNQQQENRNVQLERVNQQQKTRNEKLEIVNEQQKIKNQQQKIRIEELERVNEQQKNRNQQLERANEELKNMSFWDSVCRHFK